VTEAEQNRLITDHMHLVQVVAADYRGGSVDFEDLCGAGSVGLTKAARTFDAAKSRFSTWAMTSIRSEITHAMRPQPSEWYPDQDDITPSLDGDKIERIYEYDSWGDRGNASAICEQWSQLGSTPEDLAMLYEDIANKRDKFSAAFISLTGAQRKLVDMVFLRDMPISVSNYCQRAPLNITAFTAAVPGFSCARSAQSGWHPRHYKC